MKVLAPLDDSPICVVLQLISDFFTSLPTRAQSFPAHRLPGCASRDASELVA